jgi:peptide/nickel transport system substrate-binding protein
LESALFGYGEVAHALIPPQVGVDPANIEHQYPYDPELASQLLDEAGWQREGESVREKDGVPLAFTIHVGSSATIRSQLALIISEFWRVVGVEAMVEVEQDQAFGERIDNHDFEAIVDVKASGELVSQDFYFRCGTYGNRVSYCSDEAEAILDELDVTTDPAEQLEVATRLQNVLMADLAWLPLYFERAIWGISTRVHNVYPNGLNPHFNMETWWVEA